MEPIRRYLCRLARDKTADFLHKNKWPMPSHELARVLSIAVIDSSFRAFFALRIKLTQSAVFVDIYDVDAS
jgi:hypothetical protein